MMLFNFFFHIVFIMHEDSFAYKYSTLVIFTMHSTELALNTLKNNLFYLCVFTFFSHLFHAHEKNG